MSRRSTTAHRTGPAAVALFVVAVIALCGAIASWTPAPDGLIGFLFVAALAAGLLFRNTRSGGRSSRTRSTRTRRR